MSTGCKYCDGQVALNDGDYLGILQQVANRTADELYADWLDVTAQITALGPLPSPIPAEHRFMVLNHRRNAIEIECERRLRRQAHTHPGDALRAMVEIAKRPALRTIG